MPLKSNTGVSRQTLVATLAVTLGRRSARAAASAASFACERDVAAAKRASAASAASHASSNVSARVADATTATAIALTFAFPAFADCSTELKMLEQKVVSAETGASTSQSGMPATEHQEQVLPGKQDGTDPGTTASTGGAVKPTSPHQEQVTGKRAEDSAGHASQLLADARKLSESGDEQGCMQKAAELKQMLGAK